MHQSSTPDSANVKEKIIWAKQKTGADEKCEKEVHPHSLLKSKLSFEKMNNFFLRIDRRDFHKDCQNFNARNELETCQRFY